MNRFAALTRASREVLQLLSKKAPESQPIAIRNAAGSSITQQFSHRPEAPFSRQTLDEAIRSIKAPSPRHSVPLESQLGRAPPLINSSIPDLQLIFDYTRTSEASGRNSSPSEKMKSWVEFLTTPTADTPGTALVIHFDDQRYIIGQVGEGLQRASIQRGVSLGRVEDVFISGTVCWKNTGGLLGLLLTVADIVSTSRDETEKRSKPRKSKTAKAQAPRQPEFRIHGPRNITHLLATARRFIFRKGIPLNTTEFSERAADTLLDRAPDYSDKRLLLWALPLYPDNIPQRSRKRNSEEISTAEEPGSETLNGDGSSEEERNDQIRRAVVTAMFNSEWKLDALHKSKLAEVEMPATIFIRNEQGHIEPYKGPLPGGQENVPDIDVLIRKPWPAALVESLPSTVPSSTAMSYIIKCQRQRGKFLVEKAKQLNLMDRKYWNTLCEGNTVTLEDGRIITPEMVLEESRPGGGFVLLDIPTLAYVDAALARREFNSPDVMAGVEAFIWLLGPGILADDRIQQFMKAQTKYRHIVSSTDCCPNTPSMSSHFEYTVHQNQIDSDHFPIPASSVGDNLKQPDSSPYSAASPGKRLVLTPNFEVQDDKIWPVSSIEDIKKKFPDDVKDLIATARTSPSGSNDISIDFQDIPSPDAEVLALGTGSALPSKYRNVSSTMLRVPGLGNYLFDCGENTLGQLRRIYGADLPNVLRELKVIWISHLHADHHLGTTSVIKAWHEATKDDPSLCDRRLIVASDIDMLRWLEEYSEVEEFGYSRIVALKLSARDGRLQEHFHPESVKEFGLTSIRACRVSHCRGALAVVFDFPTGLRVAYSGDCRPSTDFARLGKDSTLLIHEATFDDDLQGDARAKKHSTVGEALEIAAKMKAKRVMLTHFSQRYPGAAKITKTGAGQPATSGHGSGSKTSDPDDLKAPSEIPEVSSTANVEQCIPIQTLDTTTAENNDEPMSITGEAGVVEDRNERKAWEPPTIYALDFMRCRLQDFSKLQELRPALQQLYSRD